MREDVSDGESVVSGEQIVGQYLDEWLRDAVEPSVSCRTYEKRAWSVNLHIKPVLVESAQANVMRRLNAGQTRSEAG